MIATFVLCGLISSEAQVVNVDLFNADNGLPQTNVNAAIQDSIGFLWIGTADGLCRYDGYQFVTYTNNPLDSFSICNNYIYSIADDRKGNLWIGTRYGLSRFEKSSGRFINYYASSEPNSLSSNVVYSVFCDKQGYVWAKTLEALHCYNPSQNNFISYQHYNDIFNLPSEVGGFPIYEDSQSRLWVGTKDGLMLLDKQLSVFKKYSHDPLNVLSLSSNRITAIFEDSKGQFWVGTDNGLNQFDFRNNIFRKYHSKTDDVNCLLSRVISFIGEDKDESLWIGSDNGFCKIHADGSAETIQNLVYNNQKVSPKHVSVVLRDKSNVLWIGSQIGLVKWNPFESRFEGFGKDIYGNALFSNNNIVSILDDNGNIWLGTRGDGLHLFNPTTGSNIRFSKEKPSDGISNDFVNSIFKTSKGELLVGSNDGLFLYKPNIKKFVDFFDSKGIYCGDIFSNNRINSIVEDKNGNLWIATRVGLHLVKDKNVVSFYSRRRDSLSLSSNEVFDVLVDRNGNIWAATNNGLDCIATDLSKVTVFQRTQKYTGIELISNEILCLHEDKNGFIWIGTTSGLHRYNREANTFKLYADQQNLPTKIINAIEEDSSGRLWISTNKGLVMLNPLTDMVRTYTTSDGLLSNEFNPGASYKSVTGKMYFGSSSGFNFFSPDSIPININVPNVSITRVEIIGSQGVSVIYPNNLDKIKVPQNFKTLTIEFSALDFNYPEKNLYRYQMSGLDDKWIEAGYKHSATFTNLSEGMYYFKVMGANSDQIWCESPTVLKVQILAPFWRSKLAFFAYITLVFGIIISYLFYRNKNLKRINNLLQEREVVMFELEKQKEELMLKNKNITDSINYAKRIQDAILPPIDSFKTSLPDSFILFMPKDIVSGDFYWVNETKNKTFVAVVDCTGHGVPGAFMSIIGIELLRNITNIEGVDDAAEILNRLSISIHETFSAGVLVNEGGIKVKDGMDVAFCVIDKEYNILQYSGAYSNLYLLRDGKIIEVKGDRYSVGMASETGHLLFSSHYIPIQPDDMIYIFTDGYVDQFGGPEGKKFKFRRFRHLLLNIHKMPLDAQRKHLYDSIMEWKGEDEQVDDILIIGIRPDLSCMF
ncbi:MAG: two-component regulator propeller domain-containing protein [Bacteroidales bacterium]